MKDKLVKTGRKGIYYKARRFFLATLLFATLAATVTVTTIISVTGGAKAQEERVLENSETLNEDLSDENESNSPLLLHY